MSEDLLLELKAAAPIVADLEGLEKQGPVLEQLWRLFLDQVGAAVEGMKGSSLAFENVWRRAVLDVAGGRTAEVHRRPGPPCWRPSRNGSIGSGELTLLRGDSAASHGAEAPTRSGRSSPRNRGPGAAEIPRLRPLANRGRPGAVGDRGLPALPGAAPPGRGDARTPSRVVRGRGGPCERVQASATSGIPDGNPERESHPHRCCRGVGDSRVRLAAGSDRPRGSA